MATQTNEIILSFFSAWKQGFRWGAIHATEDIFVGLCAQPFCEICNLTEREKLSDFRGGSLRVRLTYHRRPSFWEPAKTFALGHLIELIGFEEVETDEGIEFDFPPDWGTLNTVVFSTPQGVIVVDPGSMGFQQDGAFLQRLIAGKKVLGNVVTHAHLDHWDALEHTRGRIFMGPLCYHLADRRARLEHNLALQRALRTTTPVQPGEPVLAEDFPVKIDTIALPHSIPETTGLVIQGSKQRAVVLGDFKLTGIYPESRAQTIQKLERLAQGSVDLVAINIINAHIEGFTRIEALVTESFTTILPRAKGRVIIPCFSTNIERIRRLVAVAQSLGRPVSFVGSGMENTRNLLRAEDSGCSNEKAVIFTTGCQAEERSALWKTAYRWIRPIELRPSDILAFSARAIPGNEEAIANMVKEIRPRIGTLIMNEGEVQQLGLQDLGVEEALTHISGHGCKEDIRLALELLRPKKLLAWPQTSPQIDSLREITQDLGIEILPEQERIIEV